MSKNFCPHCEKSLPKKNTRYQCVWEERTQGLDSHTKLQANYPIYQVTFFLLLEAHIYPLFNYTIINVSVAHLVFSLCVLGTLVAKLGHAFTNM